jgi:putative nucleotidyltransferase with HDIG domain
MNGSVPAPATAEMAAGVPAPGSPADPLALRLEREIREGRVELPVLPNVALEVQDLIERDADVAAIARSIEKEPSVAAGLIKYANAAVYTGLREVTEIEHAVLRLGLNSVREVVVSLSAASAFRTNDRAHQAFYQTVWAHSLTTAIAARRLAASAGVPRETAFLAGLIHDIGRIVVFRGIETLRRRDPQGFNVPDHTISEFTDALHCRIGETLCRAWNVPPTLTRAVAWHHDAAANPKDVMTALVEMADLMAAKIGASLNPDPDIKLMDRPSFALLQLDDVKVASLLVDLEDQRETMMEVF